MYLEMLKILQNKLNFALVKTISYRIFASSLTFIIVLLQTGHIQIGLTLSLLELLFKPFLYFFHEIIWLNIQTIIRRKRAKNILPPINVKEEILPISKIEKELQLNQKGISIWFTGLSGRANRPWPNC